MPHTSPAPDSPAQDSSVQDSPAHDAAGSPPAGGPAPTLPSPASTPPSPAAALPPLAELRASARVVSLPLSVRFRGVTHREALLIEGPEGWGEFCPFLEYGPEESSRWLACAVESAYRPFPERRREQIPVNATVPAVPAEDVAGVLARSGGRIREVKIKVAEAGQDLRQDLERVAAVARAAPEAVLKMDANGGWDEEQAVRAVAALAEFSPAYIEQPVPTVEGLARVRQRLREEGVDTPIAADESVRKAADPLHVARAGAADLIVVKAAPLGGPRRAVEIIEQAGLPAVVSSALETSVGLCAGLALAAALPELPHACGLGTASLYAADLTERPLIPEDGLLPATRLAPDPDLLERHAVDAQRRRWWIERLERSYEHLAERGPDPRGA